MLGGLESGVLVGFDVHDKGLVEGGLLGWGHRELSATFVTGFAIMLGLGNL